MIPEPNAHSVRVVSHERGSDRVSSSWNSLRG
jgi:hypothetical protein